MTIMNYAYRGRGRVWLGAAGQNTAMRDMGNVSEATLSFAVEESTLKDFRTCAGGNYASALDISEAAFGLVAHDISPQNFDLAFYGNGPTAIPEGAATEEQHTVPTLSHLLVETADVVKTTDTVTVSSATSGGGTVYVEGQDYNVFPGGIQYLLGSQLSGGETVFVNFVKREVDVVQALMSASVERYMRIDGLNCQQSGAPVVVSIFRAKPAPTDGFQLIGEDFAQFNITGKMDADPSKGSNESQYFKAAIATTV